jgi:phytanoyl-CoA hydroxylase
LKSRWVRAPEGGMKFEVYDPEPWAEDELVPLEVSKGSLIVLDGLLPHRSYENRSPRSRHAYTVHLMDADADYPNDNWLQRQGLRGF